MLSGCLGLGGGGMVGGRLEGRFFLQTVFGVESVQVDTMQVLLGGRGNLFSLQPMEGPRCLAFIPFKFGGREGLVVVSMGNIKCSLQCKSQATTQTCRQSAITGDAEIHVRGKA